MATSVTLKPNAIDISGSTSGTTTLQASAVAGTTTLTLPAATDTLVGKATTDTLTNKTLTGAAMNGTLGATTPSTASVTTLTTSSTVTHSGGTANGVAYLDGSKVLTTGSALVFDGTNLGLGVTPSAWSTNYKVVEIGKVGSSIFTGISSGNILNASNAYLNSSDAWTYRNNGYAAYSAVRNTDTSLFTWNIASSGTAGNAITFTQAMTLDASGNLGIGTSSPATKFHVSGSGSVIGQIETSGTQYAILRLKNSVHNSDVGADSTSLYMDSGGAYPIVFYTGATSTERARIDSSGNLLVGKTALGLAVGTSIDANTSTGSGVRVVSSASTSSADGFQMYSTGAGAYRFYVSFNGTISATTTTISAISDARFKENVRDLDAGLAEVMALKPRLYDWKEGKGADIKNARGFIAQEFEQVFPDLIDEWKDPAPEGEEPYKSVRQDLIPVLVKALQEMKTIIDQQAERIAALEAK